jgi:hypothetical protein
MVNFLFGVIRLLLGLVGAWWLVTSVLGVIETVLDHAWGAAVRFALLAPLGFALPYFAFVRAPWEQPDDSDAPAA